MLGHYDKLKPRLDVKVRGRKREMKLCSAPELWARSSEWTANITVNYEGGGNDVATLRPDNSLTIDWGWWTTPTTCKIIHELTGYWANARNNILWVGGMPVRGHMVAFNSSRVLIVPNDVIEMRKLIADQLDAVTLDDLSPKDRLRKEIGAWEPKPSITQRVVAYCIGRAEKSTLSGTDIVTCTNSVAIWYSLSKQPLRMYAADGKGNIMDKCLETLIGGTQ